MPAWSLILFPYFSWNSGDARATNHLVFSSVAWLSRLAVCSPTTPSRCWRGTSCEGGNDVACASVLVTKFTCSMTVLLEIHASLFGQPPTSGGSNRAWPMPEPDCAMRRARLPSPSANAAWTIISAGDLTSERSLAADENSGLVKIERMSVFMSYLLRRKPSATRRMKLAEG